jgi:hypothetical protein
MAWGKVVVDKETGEQKVVRPEKKQPEINYPPKRWSVNEDTNPCSGKFSSAAWYEVNHLCVLMESEQDDPIRKASLGLELMEWARDSHMENLEEIFRHPYDNQNKESANALKEDIREAYREGAKALYAEFVSGKFDGRDHVMLDKYGRVTNSREENLEKLRIYIEEGNVDLGSLASGKTAEQVKESLNKFYAKSSSYGGQITSADSAQINKGQSVPESLLALSHDVCNVVNQIKDTIANSANEPAIDRGNKSVQVKGAAL